MNEPEVSSSAATPEARKMSLLFHAMVVQQSNMALMLLGKVPHPETGQPMQDLEGARMFIDQLEMLAEKTKGNLDRHEEALLKQQLMNLRLAFVEAVNSPAGSSPAPAGSPSPSSSTTTEPATAPDTPNAAADAESRKKFTKKY